MEEDEFSKMHCGVTFDYDPVTKDVSKYSI